MPCRVTGIHVLVAVAAMGSEPWEAFKGEEAALAVISDDITGNTAGSTLVSAGAVISIFSVTLVTFYGETRILFTMGRDGLLPATFAKVNPRTMTPVGNTVIVAVVVAARLPRCRSTVWPNGLDRHPDRVHRGVRGSDSPAD